MLYLSLLLLGCPGTSEDTAGKDQDSVTDSGGAGGGSDDSADSGTDADGDGSTVEGGDCDDADPAVNPNAPEVCNEADDDCDGLVDDDDDDVVGAPSWYADEDRDLYGAGAAVVACGSQDGRVTQDGDCDDLDSGVNPGAGELCDGIDNDCDALVDGEDPDAELSDWYTDGDGDGWGAGAPIASCGNPGDAVRDDGDCDDGDPLVNPDGAEVCDGVDDDCDGASDDDDPDVTGTTPWYADGDGDGYGTGAAIAETCLPPDGSSADDTDCDDAAAGIHPGATEVCDGVDDDCSGLADDGLGASYADADGDGYGDPAAPVCDGGVGDGSDCDDADPDVHPGAIEVCDGVDDDCDGAADDADPDTVLDSWYPDGDGDGHGVPTSVTLACTAPPGTADLDDDCDDADASVYPGAGELYGDGVDDDCDGLTTPAWSACVGLAVPADYASLADALAVAGDGDTICLEAGTWAESVDVPAGVELMGVDPDTAVIAGTVRMTGGTLRQLGVTGGVTVAAGADVTLEDVRLSDTGGVVLDVSGGDGLATTVAASRVAIAGDRANAGVVLDGSACTDGSGSLTLTLDASWVTQAAPGLDAAGGACATTVTTTYGTWTTNSVGLELAAGTGGLTASVAGALFVGNTLAVEATGAGTVDVSTSWFYAGGTDLVGVSAGTGVVTGTDPEVESGWNPPILGEGSPALDGLPGDRVDYWGVGCAGAGCDYGAVERP